MNIKKIALLVGIFCIFAAKASNSLGPTWFDCASAFRNGKNPFGGLLARNVSYLFLKEHVYKDMWNNGVFDRLGESSCYYDDWKKGFSFNNVNPDLEVPFKVTDLPYPNMKNVIRPVLYIASDELVSPHVFNSSNLQEVIKDFSPENQKAIKNTITVVAASALSKSAEALYDHHYNIKTLDKSAKDFAVNAGIHVASKTIYISVVKPMTEEQISEGLQPVGEFVTEYATAYCFGQLMKSISK